MRDGERLGRRLESAKRAQRNGIARLLNWWSRQTWRRCWLWLSRVGGQSACRAERACWLRRVEGGAVRAFDPADVEPFPERDVAAAPVVPQPSSPGCKVWFSLFGIELKLRLRLQNHVVLIQLRIHRVDLALAKGVVQRVVDGGRRDAQPRSGDAVDHQRDGKPARLLIGGHILQLRQLLQLRDKAVGPQFSSFWSGSSSVY